MPDRKDLFRDTLLDQQFCLGSEHEGYIPTPSHRRPFTGEAIGTIAYNPETGDLRVTPYADEPTPSEKPITRQPD